METLIFAFSRNKTTAFLISSSDKSIMKKELLSCLAGAAGLVLLIIALFYPWLGQAML